ncbi:MAG: WXG100 family type VII secretion target [Peptococcaceae bacterium]|nr:WXG100 family type VII secretion target [Peptococcaceae bacterium]
MSDEIRIDTEMVSQIAMNIERLNQEMLDTFNGLEDSMESLFSVWKGQAAGNAKQAYRSVKYDSNGSYKTLKSVANFLRIQIGEGYEETEERNTDLASLFK